MDENTKDLMLDMLKQSSQNAQDLQQIGRSDREILEDKILNSIKDLDDDIYNAIIAALTLEKAMEKWIVFVCNETGHPESVSFLTDRIERSKITHEKYNSFRLFRMYHEYRTKVKTTNAI